MTHSKTSKVAVSKRALIQRINRKLASEQWPKSLKSTRGGRAKTNLGDFYVVDLHRNLVVDAFVDPEKYGRKLGVLAPYERVAED